MKKKIIFLVVFLFGGFSLFSQENIEDNKTHFSIDVKEEDRSEKSRLFIRNNFNNLFSNTEINILVGATQFYGDIKQFDFRPSYSRFSEEIKPSYELSITKKINPLMSMRGSFISGKFGGIHSEKIGDDYEVYDPYNNFYEGDGEYFVTNFNELDLQLLLNLSNVSSFFSKINLNNFNLFLKTGIGIHVFNSLNRNFSGTYIYSYGYEEGIFQQNDNFIKKPFLDSPKEIVYLYGLNSEYILNDKINLNLDITKRKGNTDYWDSHNNNDNNDFFNFYSFGFSYKILNQTNNDWLTPIENIEKDVNSNNANIEWLSEDKDNDGVSDAFDKEPNTPIGVAVDGAGVSLDVDMDNIPDYLDSDPFSTRGAIVDNNGVEFDTDNDGIPDSKDLESNTEIGAIVNQYGITVSVGNSGTQKSYLPSIYFESGSSYINNSNLKRIATIAIMMNNNPNIKLLVIGNTDENGTTEFNNKLALKRSEEVINYLASNFNIDKNRFVTSGNGEEKPLTKEVVSAEFPNGNTLSELNRRVDFQIIR
ncbi:MAG: OmpA family protein [Flavobacteriales bacterium]|nr:OmpA family protein [Flavobacteriales bacterium]